MREAHHEFEKRGVKLLVVSSTDLEMTSFVAEVLHAPYPIFSDPSWSIFYAYGMGSGFGVPLPGTFILDEAGVIRWRWYAPFSPVFTPPPAEELLGILDEMRRTRD